MKQKLICATALALGTVAFANGTWAVPLLIPQTVQQKQANTIKVSGTVLDKNNEPLIGVYVKVAETQNGAVTDSNGHFYLDVPSGKSQLEFTYIGYKKKVVPVGKEINFTVVMNEELKELDQVVVTGFSAQKRVSVVGAIQTIQPNDLMVGSSRSMSNNLAGQLAGVIAVKPSGEPGYDNSNFWIRGISTFGSGSTPLVLVDGVERSLNDIDPAEIESFSVLKDASASAMYGVRGANGVIIINTKRGQVAKPSIYFRLEHAIESPTKLPKFVGAAEYMTLLDELRPDMFSKEQVVNTYNRYDSDLYPNVNWLDAVTKDYAYSTRANMTVSGGSNFLRYSLTASVYHEDGIMDTDHTLAYDTGTHLTRYNMRANVDLNLTKTTLLRFNIGGFLQKPPQVEQQYRRRICFSLRDTSLHPSREVFRRQHPCSLARKNQPLGAEHPARLLSKRTRPAPVAVFFGAGPEVHH